MEGVVVEKEIESGFWWNDWNMEEEKGQSSEREMISKSKRLVSEGNILRRSTLSVGEGGAFFFPVGNKLQKSKPCPTFLFFNLLWKKRKCRKYKCVYKYV